MVSGSRAAAAEKPSSASTAPGDDLVVMADIVGAYGVNGWVKVRPYSEQQDAMLHHSTWWLRPRQASVWRAVELKEGRVHSGLVVAQLSGVDSRESALELKGAQVGVPRARLPAPAEGEVYHADLVGLEVVNRAGARFGRVVAVQEFGAHPVLRVVDDERKAERLIPFVSQFVDGVDLAARRIDVDWEADY